MLIIAAISISTIWFETQSAYKDLNSYLSQGALNTAESRVRPWNRKQPGYLRCCTRFTLNLFNLF